MLIATFDPGLAQWLFWGFGACCGLAVGLCWPRRRREPDYGDQADKLARHDRGRSAA